MTNAPDPGFFSGGDRRPDGQPVWWWRLLDAEGRPVPSSGTREEFPSRGDAESWLGESFADLAEQGVAAVTLVEGERDVYGPMSLAEG